MAHQSEAQLEDLLIKKLEVLNYERIKLTDYERMTEHSITQT